jgi:hypothetical protein
MQRGTTVNTQDLCGFLKFVLAGFFVVQIIIIILVAAARRPVLLLLLGLAAATPSGSALLAGPTSTVWSLLLVAALVLSFLLLDKLLDSPTILEIMPFGTMDLAVLLVGAVLLIGSCQGQTVGACGNLLAGAVNLGLLGAAAIARLLNGKHSFALSLSVVPPPAFLCRGGTIALRAASCGNTFAGKFPSLLSSCTLVGKSIELADVSDLGHGQFLPHLAVTHVLMKRANDRGRVDIWNVVLYTAEPLNVFAQGLSFLLGDEVQVTLLAMRLMAAGKGANKLMAQVRPRRNGVLRQMHEPRHDVAL